METLPKVGKTNALSNPVTSNSVSKPQEPKSVNNDKVISPGMFRINPSKTFREEKHVLNIVRASTRTKPITVSQPPVFTRQDVNSNLNGLSSTGVDNTKTRRPQPRSNTKNDRVPSASKSSRSKNKEAKLLINFFWKFMGTVRFGNDHVAAILGFGDLQVYNRRTKKIMETMNVSFDELSAMDFEQRSSKPRLNSMTSGHISLGLDLTYAPSTITTQQPSEGELDLLFKAMYDAYISGQPSATARTVPPAQEPQVHQSSTASTTIADTAPIPTNSSSLATNIQISSQDVDELNLNAMIDGNMFVNPFANSSTSAAASSSQPNVDP
nr:hypothetical protein [Tanacetum cinerariifolium]